jgi:hypothetical protein
MIGVCPNCGKPFRIDNAKGGEGWAFCENIYISPADMPTGERLMADQATKLYIDWKYARDEAPGIHQDSWF